ncbi:zinc finger protein 513a isoform X1 [Anguilla rostrata]|uniref:zinc finger protein 513a isoform X1 n=2 Tax=Anguilla rostrata TaxID=7938 RepID=UPI0030D3C64C
MPRRKQLNPQPVKLDSEDGLGSADPASFVLESDFLLERHLQFDENDTEHQILEPERGEGDTAELIGLEEFPLCFTPLSMESQADHAQDPESEAEEGGACASCGQSLSLAGPYCPRCGDRGKGRGFRSDPAPHADEDEDEALQGGGEEGGDGPPKLHTCKLCSFSSRYSNHLKRHMKTHNGEKPYRCPLCAYASAQLVNLQRHLRIHTGEKPYSCAHCHFACSSLGNLKRHQRMHAQEQHSHCSTPLHRHVTGQAAAEGTDESAGEAVLRSHHHGDHLNPGNDPPQDAGGTGGGARAVGVANALPELLFPFTCRLCGVVLDDEDGTSAQICSSCTLDMLTKAPPSSPGERGERVFSCALCSFTTQYPNHLARHMKTHSGEKPYKCPQCDYASAHFDNLKRHHRVHTGEKPYKCHLCDYACGNLANLKRHQRIHSGAKPFQCAVCSYSCNQSMNLKRHMLRHTGEKPFCCQECPYTTGHWDNYKRHQRKHGHSAHGWVKVQLPHTEEEEDEEEEEEEEEDV